MDEGIFFIRNNELSVLRSEPYDNEPLLQELLEKHPRLLAGYATGEGGANRLLLVRREMPVAAAGIQHLSLDHLFLDDKGVPVLVEVKRSADTRSRREVVAQMLDYAANAVKNWPVALLQESLESLAAADEAKTVDELIQDFAQESDPQEFWRAVQANLDAGRIRMIFVVDQMPSSLARIIEFLNKQMSPAEVLGVEVTRYVGNDGEVFVPSVVGRTAAAQDKKDSPRVWSEAAFLDAARAARPEAEYRLIERLLAHLREQSGRPSFGISTRPGVAAWYDVQGTERPVWNVNAGSDSSPGYFYIWADKLPPHLLHAAKPLLQQVNAYGSKIEDAANNDWKARPKIRLDDLVATEESVDKLLEALSMLAPRDQDVAGRHG